MTKIADAHHRARRRPAALVYEAVEPARTAPTTADIVRAAGVSRTTAAEAALSEMAALGMVHRDHALEWHTTAAADLARPAIRLGAADDVAEQISLHRLQRAAWHAYLDRHTAPPVHEADLYDPERDEYWLPQTTQPWPPSGPPHRQGIHLL